MVRLMDCTLRDGANVVGKGFDAEITKIVLDILTESNVPIIEFGNAGGIGAYEVAGFTNALTDMEYLDLVQPYLGKSEIGMFLNAKRFREPNVERAASKGMKFLRCGADAGDARKISEVPVDTDRAVVKLDAKKEEAKRKRWYGISESAAKQSKRMIVPEIGNVMKFKAAIEAAALDDLAIIPYEDSESLPGAGGMALTRELIGSLKPGQSLSIFIGPEGGFSDGEVELAMQSGVKPVTLGKRILRTETAGMFVMAAVGLLLES